eukprot:828582-Heterocapsa_arctica.AAC.1
MGRDLATWLTDNVLGIAPVRCGPGPPGCGQAGLMEECPRPNKHLADDVLDASVRARPMRGRSR